LLEEGNTTPGRRFYLVMSEASWATHSDLSNCRISTFFGVFFPSVNLKWAGINGPILQLNTEERLILQFHHLLPVEFNRVIKVIHVELEPGAVEFVDFAMPLIPIAVSSGNSLLMYITLNIEDSTRFKRVISGEVIAPWDHP
jgi:hypothetical protein